MATPSDSQGVVLGTNEYKVIIIGAVGVGKTSLLVRYIYNTFEDSSMKVISEEKKKITISGQEVVLDLWDTAGTYIYRLHSTVQLKGGGVTLASVSYVFSQDKFV